MTCEYTSAHSGASPTHLVSEARLALTASLRIPSTPTSAWSDHMQVEAISVTSEHVASRYFARRCLRYRHRVGTTVNGSGPDMSPNT
ncbi:hypothetical protein AB431_00600 [Mycobacterium sp. EPa45]|nr:hypothetical protein AB431_00600 [Mycobacterium sp. EPa45]